MRVTSLSLSHFRNYERALIEPDAGVTVFTGPNAQGKTNVLEALHLCCLGKSQRAGCCDKHDGRQRKRMRFAHRGFLSSKTKRRSAGLSDKRL